MRLLAGFAIASVLATGCVRPLMLVDAGDGSVRADACTVENPCWQGGHGNAGDIVSVAVGGAILVAVAVEIVRRL